MKKWFEVLGLFSLEKRSLGEDQSTFQYLKGIYGKGGCKEVFSRLLAGRTKGYWKKLLQGKLSGFKQEKNKKVCIVEKFKHWNRLSRKGWIISVHILTSQGPG